MMVKRSRGLLAGLAIALASSTAAYAADGQAFAERLKTLLEPQGVVLTYAGVENSGDDVVIKGAKVATDKEALDLGDLTFETVAGTAEQGFTAARLDLQDVDKTENENRLSIKGMEIEGLQLAGTAQASDPAMPTSVKFDRAGLDSMTIQQNGKDVVTLGTTEMTSTGEGAGGISGTFNVSEFMVDTTADPESEGSKTMAAIGYPQVRGSIDGTGAWTPADGKLTLDPLKIVWQDAGELDFAYTITGYTPAFIQQLSQLQAQMAANPEASDSTGMAVLGLISQLYLNNARLSFTDNSLTDKLLEYYAQRNGQTRDELVTNLKASLPPILNYLQNQAFQERVQAAVDAYLDNPENMTITIAPQTPVPATQVMGAAMGAPQTLPQVLNLEVTSNQ
ncbi:hypothetical protein [Aureimonas frigidaquae]|uniref:Uncharacterized protein n=1 Tax=Aureimonas frigidaquae TaxID=424757 RepID=A0A0P0Z4A5_9HYPH|nr:hypothetical protein [Aureimonas frigidaquae]BAT28876.1 hypothetical protein [Aureimonas frigidaquae]